MVVAVGTSVVRYAATCARWAGPRVRREGLRLDLPAQGVAPRLDGAGRASDPAISPWLR